MSICVESQSISVAIIAVLVRSIELDLVAAVLVYESDAQSRKAALLLHRAHCHGHIVESQSAIDIKWNLQVHYGQVSALRARQSSLRF